MTDVKIKPLEWEDNAAKCLTGGYFIVDSAYKWLYRYDFQQIGRFETIEEAKAHAQFEYEGLILSALL